MAGGGEGEWVGSGETVLAVTSMEATSARCRRDVLAGCCDDDGGSMWPLQLRLIVICYGIFSGMAQDSIGLIGSVNGRLRQ
ncbi:hypothetical protein chiPu_0006396 [Chiloscyllium punctatum]|uniref:Uncharacterized protein n=1 Tax=Chiloscyllium punctatum TaxID=137246 RepID=A0A401SC85_CHIPU|nr:hypothetical protein [Chiloscyllium punctatum]